MPVYTPPVFNALMNVWDPPATPGSGPPTFTNIACQLYVYSRTPTLLWHPGSGRQLPLIIIRLPFTTPGLPRIDSIWRAGAVPPVFPDQYFKVQYYQVMHYGFPNEYWALYCLQCNLNGTIPRTPLPT